MMLITALLLQAIQPAPPPDIQLDVRATARRLVIHKEGEAELTVRTSLNGREGEGNLVMVEAPEVPERQRELRDVDVRVRAEARIPGPRRESPTEEPAEPQ